MTTKETISNWFDNGVANGKSHMIVICDTFDHSDYPAYYNDPEKCLDRINNPGSMQRVMEVYNLKANKESQMHEGRAMHLPDLS